MPVKGAGHVGSSSKKQSSRKAVNKHQLELLGLLYKFRFGTTDLLAKALDKKDGRFVYARLTTLCKEEYIGRNYNSTYKIRGQYASYYLLPKAIQVLRQQLSDQQPVYEPRILKNIYRDKKASDTFITHSLSVFNTYCQLKALYSSDIQLFTKSDLGKGAYDYFPNPLPDMYVSLKLKTKAKHFFIDIYHDSTPFFLLVRRIKFYIQYAEEGDWSVTDTSLPQLLFICGSPSLQKRVQKKIARSLEDNYDDELRFATATKQALATSSCDNDAIWQTVGELDDFSEPKKVVSLRFLR